MGGCWLWLIWRGSGGSRGWDAIAGACALFALSVRVGCLCSVGQPDLVGPAQGDSWDVVLTRGARLGQHARDEKEGRYRRGFGGRFLGGQGRPEARLKRAEL